jgi:hypothetical protein
MHFATCIFIVQIGILTLYSCSSNEQQPTYASKEHTESAIEFSRNLALALLRGNAVELKRLDATFNQAAFQNENGLLKEVSITDIGELQDKQIHFSLITPLLFENQERMLQLFLLERNDSFVVMSFKILMTSGEALEIPEIGPMVVVVTVRHMIDPKSERDYWKPVFYDFSFSFYEYYLWLRKHGDQATIRVLSKSTKTLEELAVATKSKNKFEELRTQMLKDADVRLSKLYDWAASTQERFMVMSLGDSLLGRRYSGNDNLASIKKKAKDNNLLQRRR